MMTGVRVGVIGEHSHYLFMMMVVRVGLLVITATICLMWRLIGGGGGVGGYVDFWRLRILTAHKRWRCTCMWQVKSSPSSIAWVISVCKIRGTHCRWTHLPHLPHCTHSSKAAVEGATTCSLWHTMQRWQLRVAGLLCPFAGCLSPRLQPFSPHVLLFFLLLVFFVFFIFAFVKSDLITC